MRVLLAFVTVDGFGRNPQFVQSVIKQDARACAALPIDEAHITALVEEMLQLQKDLAEAERNFDDKRHSIQRRIEQVDAAIDRKVYELYGLTDEEIKIVENG